MNESILDYVDELCPDLNETVVAVLTTGRDGDDYWAYGDGRVWREFHVAFPREGQLDSETGQYRPSRALPLD
jgi:hypothetical protein